MDDIPCVRKPWEMGNAGATRFTRGEAQRFARGILQSDAYRQSLEARAARGELPAAVETMLWHYGFGKPVEHVAVATASAQTDLSALSSCELRQMMEGLAEKARDIEAVEATIPAEFKVA